MSEFNIPNYDPFPVVFTNRENQKITTFLSNAVCCFYCEIVLEIDFDNSDRKKLEKIIQNKVSKLSKTLVRVDLNNMEYALMREAKDKLMNQSLLNAIKTYKEWVNENSEQFIELISQKLENDSKP